MRKSLIALAAGVSVLLTACGGGSGTEQSSPKDSASAKDSSSASAPADAGTLTLWADEERVNEFKALGEAFKAETGITLKTVQKPTADVKTDFLQQAPSGKGPDMVVGAHDWMGDLIKNGVIAPVDLSAHADAFNPVAVQAFTSEGNAYGVLYAVENIALVRNNKLLKDTPATFDELVEQGKGAKGAQFPVVIQQGEQGDAFHLYPLQTSFGAPVFKTDDKGDYTTELAMEGAKGEAFAAYLQKLGKAGVLSADMGGDQAKQAFLDGKSPYMITGPWWTKDFVEAKMDISVLPVPSAGGEPSAPFVGVQGVYVSSQSKNQVLANQFVEYVASKEAQDKLFEVGKRTPALQESADAVDDPVIKGFAEAGKDGQPMPSIPEMGAVWEYWGGTEVAIINGKSPDPAKAWQAMNANIKKKF